MIAATNGYDVGVAFMIGLPATIGAIAGLFAWRDARKAKHSAQRTEAEVKSPNGIRSGDQTYETYKAVKGLQSTVAELAVGQQKIQRQQAEHDQRDDERFAVVFDVLKIDESP